MTAIKQAYYSFMKDVISFYKTACVKYQIPVLLLSTREMSTNIFQKLILIDPPLIVGREQRTSRKPLTMQL